LSALPGAVRSLSTVSYVHELALSFINHACYVWKRAGNPYISLPAITINGTVTRTCTNIDRIYDCFTRGAEAVFCLCTHLRYATSSAPVHAPGESVTHGYIYLAHPVPGTQTLVRRLRTVGLPFGSPQGISLALRVVHSVPIGSAT
jgi:hypothetical protein